MASEIMLLVGALAMAGFAMIMVRRDRQSHRGVRFDVGRRDDAER